MNFRSLDLNLLRVFDEIMAERNITRAAANLAMTQPAVSNALKRLRETLGDELVTRSGYGVSPTPQALILWPAIRQALASLQEALTPAEFEARTACRSFILAMADATATLLIPPLINSIQTQAPGISLRVLPLTTRDPRKLIEAGEIDLAIGYFPAALAALTAQTMQSNTPERFAQQRLYESDYVCVMRRDHALAHLPLSLEVYCAANHLLVSFSGRPYGFVDEALSAINRHRRIVLTVNQFYTAGRVVASSDLLTVLPRHFLESTGMQQALIVRELPIQVSRVHVDMLWHRRQQTKPDHVWLRNAVANAALKAFSHKTETVKP
ncbi:MAG: LysR family transcriptional regulator [Burkholderiaceae bacterium]|nr:LysR family transcriptional regulator [Burkholderiaceae bacterium]